MCGDKGYKTENVSLNCNFDKVHMRIALMCKHVKSFRVIHGMSSAEFTLPKRALTHAESATAYNVTVLNS